MRISLRYKTADFESTSLPSSTRSVERNSKCVKNTPRYWTYYTSWPFYEWRLNHLQRTCRFVILNKCILEARSASFATSLYLSSCRDIYLSHKSHMTMPLGQEFFILSQSATFAFKNPCVPFCYFYGRKLKEQHVEKGVEKSTLKIIVVFFGW